LFSFVGFLEVSVSFPKNYYLKQKRQPLLYQAARCSGRTSPGSIHTNALSLANFVGIVVGFFNVCKIRLWRLLLAASLSFESEMVSVITVINTHLTMINSIDMTTVVV